MVKQVIAVRKDLGMRKGKIAAQVAHASLRVWFDRMKLLADEDGHYYETEILPEAMVEWKEGAFTKIVVGINSEEEVYDLANKANKAGIPTGVIVDNGFTEFHGNKTTTCVAIGPGAAEEIDKITGHLDLL